jgi:hypothetical protein
MADTRYFHGFGEEIRQVPILVTKMGQRVALIKLRRALNETATLVKSPRLDHPTDRVATGQHNYLVFFRRSPAQTDESARGSVARRVHEADQLRERLADYIKQAGLERDLTYIGGPMSSLAVGIIGTERLAVTLREMPEVEAVVKA